MPNNIIFIMYTWSGTAGMRSACKALDGYSPSEYNSMAGPNGEVIFYLV